MFRINFYAIIIIFPSAYFSRSIYSITAIDSLENPINGLSKTKILASEQNTLPKPIFFS